MSHACQHCHKNDDRVQCPDCEGTGRVSYCERCTEQIPGENEYCDECQDVIDNELASKEFVETLRDPDSNVVGICDRIPEQKRLRIQMAI